MTKKNPKSPVETYVINEMAQVKALSHPLRMKILETLCAGEPMTTKQVAQVLGEKPTKLYHHVGRLQKVGLIELHSTRPNRGTVEKYYQAIAKTFRADSSLFSDEENLQTAGALAPMINTIFENTVTELNKLAAISESPDGLGEEGVLSYVELHLSQSQIDSVHSDIKGLLEKITQMDDGDADEDALRKYRLTLAYYPLDRFP